MLWTTDRNSSSPSDKAAAEPSRQSRTGYSRKELSWKLKPISSNTHSAITGGEIKKDKSERTGYYENCIEAMEIFTKDFEENGIGEIIHIHVKRKKEEK